ncbi:SIMPL domain-containing protein [Belliella sp. R4-6]|uniref:SIMPL domain-containing protein n=1 Tax=Belliella alkalica TaxID=1730871 RepID=A0ABS9V8G9_9BACT|nr:SIMPL domain-containing protein [Belliella alkalica]MCH7412524.1 SIMPL domain-containing protein [Belliella alkalica]
MKKLFFMLPVLMLPFLSFAQQNQIPTIEVDGASEIEVMPDEATIQINLRELGMKVSDVTNALNKKTKAIQDAIKKTGVADYDFVVDNYYVNINRIYTKGSSKDSGYVASQNVKVRVKNIDKDLVKVLESISSKGFDLSYNMNFGISEAQRKVHQEKLLELALEDARRKADVIAKTLGIKNIRIFKVNYSSGVSFQPYEPRMETMMMKSADARVEPTFTPEAQKLSDRVSVSFAFLNES